MLMLTGKIEKAYYVRKFFVYTIDEIPAIFSNLEPGAQPKLAYAYYLFSDLKERHFTLTMPPIIWGLLPINVKPWLRTNGG